MLYVNFYLKNPTWKMEVERYLLWHEKFDLTRSKWQYNITNEMWLMLCDKHNVKETWQNQCEIYNVKSAMFLVQRSKSNTYNSAWQIQHDKFNMAIATWQIQCLLQLVQFTSTPILCCTWYVIYVHRYFPMFPMATILDYRVL